MISLDQQKLDSIVQWKNSRFSSLRPYHDFLDYKKISRPPTIKDTTARVNKNLLHYQSNYIGIVFLLFVYALMTNLTLLFTLVGIASMTQKIASQDPNQPVNILGAQLTQSQLYGILICLSLPLLWIASFGSTIFWIIGASGVVIFAHAALFEPGVETEFEDKV